MTFNLKWSKFLVVKGYNNGLLLTFSLLGACHTVVGETCYMMYDSYFVSYYLYVHQSYIAIVLQHHNIDNRLRSTKYLLKFDFYYFLIKIAQRNNNNRENAKVKVALRD